MIELTISLEAVQKRLNAIVDFIYDEETGEPLEDKLQNAWHEVFGMQSLFMEAHVVAVDNEVAAAEYKNIRKAFTDSLDMIEQLYDRQVNGKK